MLDIKITDKKITSLYQAVVSIINDYYCNDVKIISRKELIRHLRIQYDYFERMPCWSNWEKPVGCTLYSLATLDGIRNMLEKVGFLDKVYIPNTNQQKIKFGWYHIKKEISTDLTYNKLRLIYNNFQNKLKQYFEEHNLQPDKLTYCRLQIKNFFEFYGTKFK